VGLARERTSRVVVVGASMGAIAALRYAATDAGLAGVVTLSCPAGWTLPRNVRGVLAAAMTRTRVGRLATRRLCGVRISGRWTNPAPPIELATQLEVPVTYIHGTEDRFIAVKDAARLWEATAEPRRLVVLRGMGHAFEPVAMETVRLAVAWALAHELSPAS